MTLKEYLLCLFGIHDWEYARDALDTETLDRQHKVHGVKIHGAGFKNSRICLRCDKRQIHKASWGDCYWQTVNSHEWIKTFPPGQVEFRKD